MSNGSANDNGAGKYGGGIHVDNVDMKQEHTRRAGGAPRANKPQVSAL